MKVAFLSKHASSTVEMRVSTVNLYKKKFCINFFFIQESNFYAEDNIFYLKLSRMFYYNILRCQFTDVLMFIYSYQLHIV